MTEVAVSGGGIGGLSTAHEHEEPTIFEPFKQEDRVRYRLGLPHSAEVTRSLRSLSEMTGGPA